MKELTLDTLFAVFEEMFGPALFWALVAAAVLISLAFLWVVIRDRGIVGHRFLRAELVAPVGAIAAILFVQWITNSGFSDLGGPVDWITVLAIGLAGAGGAVFLAYTAFAVVGARRAARDEA